VAGEALRRRSPARWGLRTRLLVLLGTVALFLAVALGALFTFSTEQRRERNRLFNELVPATEAVADLRAAVIEQETGVRGYVLTADPAFRELFDQGATNGATAIARLGALLGTSPDLADELAAVRARVDDWQRLVAEPSFDDRPEVRADVETPAFQEEALQAFEALRSEIDVLAAQLQSERVAGVAELRDAADAVTRVTIVQVAGVLLLGVLIVAALSRQVVAPIHRLGRDARLVAAGDLTHRVSAQGPPELERLGDDVDGMRQRILAELEQIRAARAALEVQAAELQRSNDDLEQFAYVASHDLQEPLRKVSGFCQLLQMRYGGKLDERADEYIFYAVDGAKRMQDLINDLLAFSRVGRTTERFVRLDLNDAVSDACDALTEMIEESGTKVNVGDLPMVDGDRRLLVATFQNLIANAIKFRRDDPPEVAIDARERDRSWEITVSDNGIGIDPQYGDQIFTIFKRLHGKAQYPGTGIGLALTKKIIEYHGGAVRLEPTEPPGATFTITLPKETDLPHEP
jgi:signal transduction histidine kinase